MVRSGARPARLLNCNSWSSIARLIANGEGVGILPGTWAMSLDQQGMVRMLPTEHRLEPLSYEFLARPDDMRPVIAALRTSCSDAVDFTCSGLLL